jgi:aspartyl-tRNA(Asn)/glutamyl-tRNA(Gln) amidotransferase subunit A
MSPTARGPALNTAFATVAELSAAFIKRALSPVDVVDQLLARIEGMNPGPRAFIDVYASAARLAAEAADRTIRSGHGVGR